ncbi:hypothetical protein [Chromobacterium vaccinii]|uniref:hypothetical protein n=1 Tax=Chromobacterium vaccinii TaxID=1108595 RepID=UPI003261458F
MSKSKDNTFPIIYKDLIFKSRMLVIPTGEVLGVSDGKVIAMTDEAFQFLADHADFECVTVPTE